MKDYKDRIFVYLMCMSFLFLCLLVSVKLFYKEDKNNDNTIVTSKIEYKDGITNINVDYPRFKNDKINSIVTDILYSYIKDFKSNEENKNLEIKYNLYYINDYLNIMFDINNSLSKVKNKNIIINLKDNKLAYITNLYDENLLKNEINDLVLNKYSLDIYNKIKDETINNFTYITSDDNIEVYFNNISFNDLNYIPYITIETSSKNTSNTNDNNGKKLIAFTFDDGPSDYTNELLDILDENNSSATFFMIGSKMNDYKDLINRINNSNSEIGMHGFSHKDLTSLNEDELLNELNTTNIIFNEITEKSIEYLRPPYGKYNESVLNLGYKIILWNIDTKDWLLKDSRKIYNNVIKNACDGCIVLMHDIYGETIDATKKLIPALNQLGYDVVSISKLLENKNYIMTQEPLSSIK